MRKRIPCIITVGEPGRAVVFGWAETTPEPDKPCELFGARMVLYWAGTKGLFGVAVEGPEEGSRLTSAVPSTKAVARQVLEVTEEAAKKLEEWPVAY